MKVDLLFLAKGRYEFTEACMAALEANTNWALVATLLCYVDAGATGVDDGTADLVTRWQPVGPGRKVLRIGNWGGPVNVMDRYLHSEEHASIFAKLDNDVIVPPGWLDQCVAIMEEHPELDLLGIEPPLSRTPAPWRPGHREQFPEVYGRTVRTLNEAKDRGLGYAVADSVGGIGLFRTQAWEERPPMKQHSTYGGFTDWQIRNKDLAIGWAVPPLKLFLLDRLRVGKWATLNARYLEEGQQRAWTPYSDQAAAELAGWWLK